jgi:hypothetical protein
MKTNKETPKFSPPRRQDAMPTIHKAFKEVGIVPIPISIYSENQHKNGIVEQQQKTIHFGKTHQIQKAVWLGLMIMMTGGILVTNQLGCGPKPAAGQNQSKATIYTCVMHHQIRRDKPGDCPICGMKLVPVDQTSSEPGFPQKKKIKYWVDPMDSNYKRDKPGKAPCGMDLVPVYEEDTVLAGAPEALQGLAPVKISPYKQQLIGVRLATAHPALLTRVIHTGGRFAGGDGDFAALAGNFAARTPLQSSGRYVVADVYALDISFVKTGQKAVVTSLSGSGERVEGKITHIYPYDETQSRVTRVKITLNQPMKNGLFANVDILAVTGPLLCVPQSAVMDTGTHRYVFVQTEPGTFSPREIIAGYQGSDLWEVTSGLKEGEQVVDGENFLIDADSKITSSFSENK